MNQLLLAIARALNAAYFTGSFLYCLLSYSSFAYEQFIRPQLIGWLPGVVAVHHELFWLTLLFTAPTMVPAIRRGSSLQRLAAAIYLAANVAIGLWLTANPVLMSAGPNAKTLILAALCLMPPFALAIVDHVIGGAPRLQRIDRRRLFVVLIAAAVAIWMSYAVLIPWYIPRTVGVDLSITELILAMALSLATHLQVFAVIYLLAAAALLLASRVRSVQLEYWILALLWIAAIALVLQRVVASALSFGSAETWVLAGWCSVVFAAIWSGIAWQGSRREGDALDLWFSPFSALAGIAIAGLVAIPLLALALRAAVVHFDWNFLLQKLGVSLVWATAAGWITMLIRRNVTAISARTFDIAAVALIGVGWITTLAPEPVRDRYASLDASYQLVRGLMESNGGEDAEFYRFLKANSTLSSAKVDPVDITFVDSFQAKTHPPHVFLFIVDSLRRDYLSPYNAAVTFTPALQAFAGEATVFQQAFTRYGATGLSVPAMWAGGMLLHKQYVLPFAPMNALEKLLDGRGYQRFMSDDHLVRQLFRASPETTLLDQGVDEMDHTVCGTVRELEQTLDQRGIDSRPIFAMTRPLQLHTARLARDAAVAATSFPGFVPGYAAQVAALDKCFGDFVGYLKDKQLYDESVVIVTSDHGESLGEEGRWGHAYTLHPEVVRVPLLIHLPSALRSAVTADPSQVALSTDITPTLYALAGETPKDRGVLYGSPLFRRVDSPARNREGESFLLVSSYGPVYAMLQHNGRSLYIANAIDGRDIAYELREDGSFERLTLTDAMRSANRELMRDHIGRIAREYRFTRD